MHATKSGNLARRTVLALGLAVGWLTGIGSPTFAATYQPVYSFAQVSDGIGNTVPILTNAGTKDEGHLFLASDGFLYGTTYYGGLFGGGVVYRVDTEGNNYQILHYFGSVAQDGLNPAGGVVQGKDGLLYGTTEKGGVNNAGTVYRMDTAGGGYKILHSFGAAGDGANPECTLMQAKDGGLYGSTYVGGIGSNPQGTLFMISPSGNTYKLLHTFPPNVVDAGANPTGQLVQASNGQLYGTTRRGGPTLRGTVYKLNPVDGSATLLYTLGGATGVSYPGSLIQGNDGYLYTIGLANSFERVTYVLKMKTDGSKLTALATGADIDGPLPVACDSVTQAKDGYLYGVAPYTAGNLYGFAFRMKTDGTSLSTLRSFDSSASGFTRPIQGSDGALYLAGSSTVSKMSLDGKSFTTLHAFAPAGTGTHPASGLVQATDGTFFGITASGGGADDGSTLFSLQPNGADFASLYDFGLQSLAYNVLLGLDGRLYGTTTNGGNSGLGTAFAIDTTGDNYVMLRSFDPDGVGHALNGANPSSGLYQTPDGRLWGTTLYGGHAATLPGHPIPNDGTVFGLNTDGSNFTKVAAFSGPDGQYPSGNLTAGKSGAFYSTTSQGGANGLGNLFRYTPSRNFFKIVYSFATGDGGNGPAGSPILASNNQSYGMTTAGGAHNQGVIYYLDKTEQYHVLYAFGTHVSDGTNPVGRLAEGPDHYLYGVTRTGGLFNQGIVFRVSRDGASYQIVHTFHSYLGGIDGAHPNGDLYLGKDGKLYGTTQDGGQYNVGTMFTITL